MENGYSGDLLFEKKNNTYAPKLSSDSFGPYLWIWDHEKDMLWGWFQTQAIMLKFGSLGLGALIALDTRIFA